MACSFASLQTEVADLKGDVAVFKADVVVLKADVASISSHLATIATSIQSMQAALTRISQAAAIKINIYLQVVFSLSFSSSLPICTYTRNNS
jgi:hypothetical protein